MSKCCEMTLSDGVTGYPHPRLSRGLCEQDGFERPTQINQISKPLKKQALFSIQGLLFVYGIACGRGFHPGTNTVTVVPPPGRGPISRVPPHIMSSRSRTF